MAYTGDIPASWCRSVVIPIHKLEKLIHDLGYYRLITLTSCLGKLMEKMVHRRIYWMFDSASLLPEAMSDFRRQNCTADGLADIASSLEEAFTTNQAAHVVLLDIHRTCDALPDQAIIDHLQGS